MDKPMFLDPSLVAARRCFRRFYNLASREDVTWSDALVSARDLAMEMINISRETVPASDRHNLERACNAAEFSFMAARDGVRECQSFRRLALCDRQHIAFVLFELYPREF